MSSQPQLSGGYPISAYQVGGQYQGPIMSRNDSLYASQMQQGDANNSQSLINERAYQSMPSPPHSQGSESPRESNITHSNKPDAPQAQQQQMQMRDANKQKPSELNTDVLRLSERIEWLKLSTRITTKIHYGKRQFVFELQDNNAAGQSAGTTTNKDSQGEGEDGNDQLPKKKLELPFKDIKKFSFTKQKQEIIIETTFEKIKQCQESMKKPGGDIKKTTQWIEKNFLLNEASGAPLFRDKEPLNIIAQYPKDSLTKSGSGRMSHLQKILLWVDVEHLFVDGERITRPSDVSRNAGQESQSFQNRDREREDSNSQAFNDQANSNLPATQTTQRQQQYHSHYNPHHPSSQQQIPLHIQQQQQQLRQQHPSYHPQLHQIGSSMGPQPPQHMQQFQGHPQGVSQQQYQSAQMQRQQNQTQYPPNAYQGQKPGGIPMKNGVGPGMGLPQQQQLSQQQQQQSQQGRHLLNQNVVKEQFNLKDNNQDNLSSVYDTLKTHVSSQKTHPLNLANPPQPQSISAMGAHNMPGNYHHPRSSSSQQPNNSQHAQISRQQSSSVHPSQQPSPYGPVGMPMPNQQYYNGSSSNNPQQPPYPPYSSSQGYPSQVKNIPYGIPSGSMMKQQHPQGNPAIMGQINPNGMPSNKQQQLQQQQQQLPGNKYDHLQRQNSQQLQQQQLLSHSQQLPNLQPQMSSSQQPQHGSLNHPQQQQAFSNNHHLNNGTNMQSQKLKPSGPYPAEDDIPDVKEQIIKLKSFIEDQKKLSSDVKREKLMERIRDLRNEGIEFTPPPDKKEEDASAQKNSKKMKCVYFKCAKELKESQMNKHIKEAHPELVKVGFEMDSNKSFRFSEQLLDFALLIADIYPVQYSDFLKQIRPALKKKKKDKTESNKQANNNAATTATATASAGTSNGNSGTGEKDKEKSDVKKKSKKSKKIQKKEEKDQLKLQSQSQQQQLDSLQQSPSSS